MISFIPNLINGIIASIIVSVLMWLFTFHISLTQIRFAEKIAQYKYIEENNTVIYEYRIKIDNVGKRDLMEVEVFGQLYVNKKVKDGRTHIARMKVGTTDFIPWLQGKRTKRKEKKVLSQTLTMRLADEAFTEFQKPIYELHIREKAEQKKLGITDILSWYGPNVEFKFFVYGNDGVTGVRRFFISKKYSSSDIACGVYKKVEYEEYHRDTSCIMNIELGKTAR